MPVGLSKFPSLAIQVDDTVYSHNRWAYGLVSMVIVVKYLSYLFFYLGSEGRRRRAA